VRNIHDMLSDKEIQDINRFCEHTNLEFGELDVLRDRDSEKIFIVDVNNTPQFQSKLSASDRQSALHKMAEALKRNTHGFN
jgi:hypothetical protein